MSDSVDRLVQVMDQLRSPGGCPWDAEQTHESLARYLLEETYEALEAMDSGNVSELREELGDLLLQIVFHARIAQEQESDFTLDSIAEGVVDKLVRRHPHVFSGASFETNEELEANWAAVKLQEKQRESVTDGVPLAMPALQLATQLIYRARKIDVQPTEGQVKDDIRSVVGQVNAESITELLVVAVELAREQDLDPESLLRSAMTTFRQEVRAAEGL